MRLEAISNPNGSVYEIDGPYEDDQFVPPEAILGAWKVDNKGVLLDEFVENELFRPIINASREPFDYMIRVADSRRNDNNIGSKQWISETDPDFQHLFPNIPKEGFTGSWYIDADGHFNGWFRPNPHYRGNITT